MSMHLHAAAVCMASPVILSMLKPSLDATCSCCCCCCWQCCYCRLLPALLAPAQMMADEPDSPAWRGMFVSYDNWKPLAGSCSPALLQCTWNRLHSACKNAVKRKPKGNRQRCLQVAADR
jgi:hypothetical protein